MLEMALGAPEEVDRAPLVADIDGLTSVLRKRSDDLATPQRRSAALAH